MRDSFIFYRSFYEAISELDNDSKLKVYEAIGDYSLNKNEPELSGISKTIFILIKPQLEANIKRFENGKQPKTKQNVSKIEAKQKQKVSKIKANNNVNDNANENIIRKFNHLKITNIENQSLLDLGYSQTQINDIYNRIENYSGNKKYKSLYLTANNWLKKEYPDITKPKLQVVKEETYYQKLRNGTL